MPDLPPIKARQYASDASCYAELHCLSNFSFLRGASHPEELVYHAHSLGYDALAITDECSLAGIVRAHVAAKEVGLKLIVGVEIQLSDGPRLLALAKNKQAYAEISALVTCGRRRSGKGHYELFRDDVVNLICSASIIWLPHKHIEFDQQHLSQSFYARDQAEVKWLSKHFSKQRMNTRYQSSRVETYICIVANDMPLPTLWPRYV